jgi:hypothetical protein
MDRKAFEGIQTRHAHIEGTIDSDTRMERSTKMAYLSHLDRGELLTEIARLNEALKDLTSRGNHYVSTINQ